MMRMDIRTTRYDHPDAVKLNDLVQREYIERYGDVDLTEVDPADFTSPRGLYLLVYDTDGTPVASGGWRAREETPEGTSDGDAEIKRMYVLPQARGRGLARAVLAELESAAAAAGRVRMVLETGLNQPEAIALYRSCGYRAIAKFGYYRDDELSVCLGKPLKRSSPADR
jgi:ribosomal protein S18 acetylase RimI-like enzyme